MAAAVSSHFFSPASSEAAQQTPQGVEGAGATLTEIGTVLRHKSPDTTAHLRKVDIAALKSIAQPWPKEGR
jgi:hypothetical protein